MSKPKVAWTKIAAAVTLALSLSGCDDDVTSTPDDESTPIVINRDVRDDVFYFVMPDRFHNANTDNDQGYIGGSREDHGFDPTHKAWYHGGDIQGLRAQLDYLEEMGVTAIWMTPILKNKAVQGDSSAYHGYWTLDFTQIDPHLGSNDDLKDLINDAHNRGIKVFFDIITNHTADVIKYEECHDVDGSYLDGVTSCDYKTLEQVEAGDTYTAFVPAGEEYTKVPEWLNDPKYYHNQGDTTFSGENSVYGDFIGLDDVNTDDPEVVQGMIDIFKNIVTDFRPDGFRIDTVKHVNIEFWQEFSPAIEAHAKAEGITQFFMFGEVYDANPQNLAAFTTTGKLPSVLDFGFQGAMRSVVADQQAPTALRDLFIADDYYNDADSDASRLMNFIGNHDMGRFGYFLADQDSPEALKKTKLAHSMMYFLRGIPVIYYGDEQGFTGDGNDQDSRENMDASVVDSYNDNILIGTTATTAESNFDQTHPIYLHLKEMADIYQQHPVLRNGIQVERYAESAGAGLYVINRVDSETGETYFVAMNNADDSQSIDLSTQFSEFEVIYGEDSSYSVADSELTLTVASLDFVVLKATTMAEVSPTDSITITGLSEGDIASGQVQLSVSLDSITDVTLPLYEVDFAYRADGGERIHIASDATAPYQLFWDVSQFDDGTALELEISTSNGEGQFDQQWVNVLVDSRVPTELSIDYQNGNDRELVFAVNQSGRMQGPLSLTNGVFDLEWDQSDQSQLLIFADYSEPFYALDKPLMITRNQVVSLSEENESEQLTAELFLNHDGELAKEDNSSSQHAIDLNLSSAIDSPLGADLNVRGGLNGWGTDLMTYIGNGHYQVAMDVSAGDVEYKYADSNWSPLNIGGPITEAGLTMSSNPSNLVGNLGVGGLTDFVLVAVDEDGDGTQEYLIPLTRPDYGPLAEPFYVRGDHNGWAADTRLSYWADGKYRYQTTFETGGNTFKVANADWSLAYSSEDDAIAVDVTETLVTTDDANDSFDAPVSAYYDFTFTEVGDTLELLIEQGATLGEDLPSFGSDIMIRGELNDWTAQDQLHYQGNDVYQIDLVITPESDTNGDGVIEFKVADADWADINFGGQAIVIGDAQTLVDDGGNMTLATPTENSAYRLTLDASDTSAPVFTVSQLQALIIHYTRDLEDYADWGVHVWGDGVNAESIPTWAEPLPFSGIDQYGRYAIVTLNDPSLEVGFIVHKGDEKNSDDNLMHTPSDDSEVWILQADATIYADQVSP